MGQENLPEEPESKAASESIEESFDVNLSDEQQKELRDTLKRLGVSSRE